ncbi:hypothetical protein AGLY_001897 [Aphis glycines]|uniref:Chromo domain-containing protein n=1 Tax=Aphis glycines TaxID=307491 RepID=A0A6G0U5M0_APHGL|nr:hypothetical protein AGLY_001897 [Aphis glycines]
MFHKHHRSRHGTQRLPVQKVQQAPQRPVCDFINRHRGRLRRDTIEFPTKAPGLGGTGRDVAPDECRPPAVGLALTVKASTGTGSFVFPYFLSCTKYTRDLEVSKLCLHILVISRGCDTRDHDDEPRPPVNRGHHHRCTAVVTVSKLAARRGISSKQHQDFVKKNPFQPNSKLRIMSCFSSKENEEYIDSSSWAPSEKIAETVIGAAEDSSGKVNFLLKWQGIEEFDLIVVKEANLMCPQLILKFYEERLTWQVSKRTLSYSTITSCASSDTRPIKECRKRSTRKKKANKSNQSVKSDDIENTVNVDRDQNGVSEDMTNNVDENGAPPEKVAEKSDLIVAKEAYLRCQQLVLKWYQDRITWHINN